MKYLSLFIIYLLFGLNREGPPWGYAKSPTLPVPMSGEYTIGGQNPDFPSIDFAVQELRKNGVRADVVLNMRSGIYNEQIIIPHIPGSSETSTITFIAESGNNSDVTWTSNSGGDYTVLLDSASWIIFENLTITTDEENWSNSIIELQNGARNNLFKGLNIYCLSSINPYLIYSPFNLVADNTYNTIKGCQFRNGFEGIHLEGTDFSNPAKGTVIQGNRFENQISSAIYLSLQEDFQVGDNEIMNDAYSEFIGIRIENAYRNFMISENKIDLQESGIGIALENCFGEDATESLTINNFIHVGGLANAVGIRVQSSDWQKVFNNSVHITSSDLLNGVGFFSNANFSSNIEVFNNIFANSGRGFAFIHRDGNNPSIQSNHNNLYSEGQYICSWFEETVTDLPAWQERTGLDPNSISQDPQFITNSDLHVQAASLNGTAIPLVQVPNDIDGESRNLVNPDIGADEFNLSGDDASIVNLISPSKLFNSGISDIQVTLQNNGGNTLNEVVINWAINGESQPPVNWIGNLPSGVSENVTLGSFYFQEGFTYKIEVFSSGPNSLPDINPTNDSLSIDSLFTALAGKYSIGGFRPDFRNIDHAILSLIKGGITDSVVFKINNGIYTDQLYIPEIEGSNEQNRIWFESKSGDSSKVILSFTAGFSQDDYLLKLDQADFITFKGVTFARGTASTGSGQKNIIVLNKGSKNIHFLNCQIMGLNDPLGSNSGIYSEYFEEGFQNSGLTVKNCLFEGGTYGVFINGFFQPLTTDVEISNNCFNQQDKASIYILGVENSIFQKNTIFQQKTNEEFAGIYLDRSGSQNLIRSNDITLQGGGYGIQLWENGSQPNAVSIYNNFIKVGGGIQAYGIYTYFSSFANIWNNSIRIDGNRPDNRVGLFTIQGNNLQLKNNIIANFSEGFLIETDSFSNLISNNNNFFTTGINLGKLASTLISDLVSWQSLSSQDEKSLSIDPLFVSKTDLHSRQVGLNGSGNPIPFVSTDIDGDVREIGAPDIGADEFEPALNDVGILSLLAPTTGCGQSTNDSITVRLFNFGTVTQTGVDITYVIEGNYPVTETISSPMEPGTSLEFTFSSTADFSIPRKYKIDLYTSLSSDLIKENDSLIGELIIVTEGVSNPPTNLLPKDGSTNIDFPINLTWSAVPSALSYDLYLWEAGKPEPSTPKVADITNFFYLYEFDINDTIRYDKTYFWKVSAKNTCSEAESSTLSFEMKSLPDLSITQFTAPNNTQSGQEIGLSWEVSNVGDGLTSNISTSDENWFDGIYFSKDSILDFQEDFLIGGNNSLGPLSVNGSYQNSTLITLPEDQFGEAYLFLVTDIWQGVEEKTDTNNIVLTPIFIELSNTPDLQISLISAPTTFFSGSTINVSWEGVNEGLGATPFGSWQDAVFLSKNSVFIPDSAIFLGTKSLDELITLEPEGTYSLNESFPIPQGIFGNYFIYVFSDYGDFIYEFEPESNNVSIFGPVDIKLTPPVNLKINSISIPDSASSQEEILIQWTGINDGGAETTEDAFWFDQVYLTDNPDSTFKADHILDRVRIDASIAPGEIYQGELEIRLGNIPTSDLYIYVLTDVFDDVYEYIFEDNNLGRSQQPISIRNPDLSINSYSVPDSGVSGTPLEIQWEIINTGKGKVWTTDWNTNIYLSKDSTAIGSNLIKWRSVMQGTLLDPNTSILQQVAAELPDTLSGEYYVFIEVNGNDDVFEDGRTENNILRSENSIFITLPATPDFFPFLVTSPDSTELGQILNLGYSISNQGSASTLGKVWQDRVYLSLVSTFDPASSVLIDTIPRTQLLVPGTSYQVNKNIPLPDEIPNLTGEEASAYIFISIDALDQVFENTGEGNNLISSSEFKLKRRRGVDLQILSGEFPQGSLRSGQDINVKWDVENFGNYTTSNGWQDGVYLSTDTIWDSQDVLVGQRTRIGNLANGQGYTISLSTELPNGTSGVYYPLIVSDILKGNEEREFTNNVWKLRGEDGLPQSINIQLSPSPDFEISSFEVPTTITTGKSIPISWEVDNRGTGTTQNSWVDKVYISQDITLDESDSLLISRVRLINLDVGNRYQETGEIVIPANFSGNYVIILVVDATDAVFEQSGEYNNQKLVPVLVNLQPPGDLSSIEATLPDSAIAGKLFPISYSVQNSGNFPIQGTLINHLYLSLDSIKDSEDIFLGVDQANNIDLLPGDTLNRNISFILSGASIGSYYLLVELDAFNYFEESDENNNLSRSSSSINISVSQLTFSQNNGGYFAFPKRLILSD